MVRLKRCKDLMLVLGLNETVDQFSMAVCVDMVMCRVERMDMS